MTIFHLVVLCLVFQFFIQVKDDLVVIESEIARSITFWRSSKGFSEFYSGTHVCNGQKCSFHRIDNVYLCFETGKAHG